MCQVVVAAMRKWKVRVPEDGKVLYEIEGETKSAMEVGSLITPMDY